MPRTSIGGLLPSSMTRSSCGSIGRLDRNAQRRGGDVVLHDAPQRGRAERSRHDLATDQTGFVDRRLAQDVGAADVDVERHDRQPRRRQTHAELAAARLARAPLEGERRRQRRRRPRRSGLRAPTRTRGLGSRPLRVSSQVTRR